MLSLVKHYIMAKKDALKRQLLIIQRLRKTPASFTEINNYLKRKETETDLYLTISQRTFQRDCITIRSIWDIDIEFNKRDGVYEIVEQENDVLLDRVLEAFDTVAALQQAKKLGPFIHLEKRKSKGLEFFNDLIYAIQNNMVVTFEHQSYWLHTVKQRMVVPKAIKEVQNRYYLVAWDVEKKDFRNFGLDRVSDLVLTHQEQLTPDIDISAYYEHTFGIERHGTPQTILIEFNQAQKAYLLSLPLHKSQKILQEKEHTFIASFFMQPTNELIMEIMRYGSICEVLAPKELRERVMEEIAEMQNKYKLQA